MRATRDVHPVRPWSVSFCFLSAACSGSDETLGQVAESGGAGSSAYVASTGAAPSDGTGGAATNGGSAGRAAGGRAGSSTVGVGGGSDTGGMVASAGGTSAGAGSGGTSTGGANAATGGSSGTNQGGESGNAGSSSSCSTSLTGQPCMAGASCNYTEPSGCSAISCVCSSGLWACARSTGSCGMCPTPQNAHCGDPCNVTAQGCLCECGNGPNFGGCSCTAGTWQCLGC